MIRNASIVLLGWLTVAGGLFAEPARWTEPLTGIEFVRVPGGCFPMGSDQRERPSNYAFYARSGNAMVLADDEGPAHQACVEPLWVARYELTEAQQQALEGAPVTADGDRPAHGISWNRAMALAGRLSERSPSGDLFRLPSEAEWEYLCSDGVGWQAIRQRIHLDQLAWAWGTQAQAVGQLQPNRFGLYDLLGNVWEWTSSDYAPYSDARHLGYRPTAGDAGRQKVMRGGSYRTQYDNLGCTRRGHSPAGETLRTVGLRLVRIER